MNQLNLSVNSRLSVPSFPDLLGSLPAAYRTGKVQEQLKRSYDIEYKRIAEYVNGLAEQGKEFSAVMYLFSKGGGSQWVAEFAVNDLSIPRTNAVNWHCQNTSQWVYAGCILFDERRFKDDEEYIISTHH